MRFRIIALPIARARKPLGSHIAASENSPFLVYYHFQSFPEKTEQKPGPPNLFRRAINGAVGAWSAMGKAPEGNWKRRIFTFGEGLMDRIDFEETALKNVRIPSRTETEIPEQEKTVATIPLLYPRSLSDPARLLSDFVAHRGPMHRRGFLTWLIIAPLTTPFMLVPVIPNLPFFFSAWRSWSHWRAWKSTEYIQNVMKKDLVIPEFSEPLESVYSPTNEGDEAKGRLLLSPEQVKQVVTLFELDNSATVDLLKALEQAKQRLGKQEKEPS